jgi:hypothetical protein
MVSLRRDPNRVRLNRKHIIQMLGTQSAVSTFSIQLDVEARRFLLRMLQQPRQPVEHIRRLDYFTSIYNYKYEAISNSDESLTQANGFSNSKDHLWLHRGSIDEDSLVSVADKSAAQFSIAVAPGTWIVDSVPICKHTSFRKIS